MRHLVLHRSGPRRALARAAAAAALVTAAALPAHAQSAGPQFTDDVLEITAARLGQLVAGLDAEATAHPAVDREHAAGVARYEAASAAYPARYAQYERDVAAWQARVATYDACKGEITARWEQQERANPDRAEMTRTQASLEDPAFQPDLQTRMEDMAARMQAAQARGDQRAMLALSDSVQRLMAPMTQAGRAGAAMAERAQGRAETAAAEIRRTCGEDPEPARPESPPSPNSLLPTAAYERLEEEGARGARLSRRQYAVLKERVGAYLALTKHGKGIASDYAYAPAERAALDAALPGLRGRPEVLDW